MAIYHLEAKVVSRGSGRSAVAASAYLSCTNILNDYDGVRHDYTRKKGLVWEQIFLPEYAPTEWQDRSVLWNAVEENEKTKDSRLAREFVPALPVELTPVQWQELLTDFIQNSFVADGMCADVAIHDPYPPGHNPHAHIMLTVRPLDEQGQWQYKTEKEYLCVKDGEEQGFTAAEFKVAQANGWEKQYQYKVGKKKVYMAPSTAKAQGLERVNKYPKSTKYGRQNPISERWNSEEQLVLWRKAWADVTNRHLELAGCEERIDHRSHADRGLDGQPTIHEGVVARALEKKGIISDRCEINRQIKEDNRLLRELKAVITSLSKKVQDSIPVIAAKLEALRDSLIIGHYQFSFNKMQLTGIKEFSLKKKPLLDELKEIRQSIKGKSAERKKLQAEKKQYSVWEIGKHVQFSQQITTLTEDIEELKSRRVQIMASLDCKDDKEMKSLEAKVSKLEDVKPKIENQQRKLKEQNETNAAQYAETLESIASEALWKVEMERRNLRYGGRTELIEKLREIYGDRFIRRQYDVSEKAIDDSLPVRELLREQESVQKQLQQEQQHQTQPEKKKKRDEWER